MSETRTHARNRYEVLILTIFRNRYKRGMSDFEFERSELESVAENLGVKLPKNLGDLIYSFRYRSALPAEILATETGGKEWVIEPAGRARYRFKLAKISRIVPRPDLIATKIPDATPEIITAYALSDEQALLAKVRYNRLVDIFLGLTTYSLQNHMRTTVKGLAKSRSTKSTSASTRTGSNSSFPFRQKVVRTSSPLSRPGRIFRVAKRNTQALAAARYPRNSCETA